MRIRVLASALLAAAIAACESDGAGPIDLIDLPDSAVGTYEKQVTGQSRSANCGTFVVVNGTISLTADHKWSQVDINTTPGGSSVCGFIGGTWARVNVTTLTLTADPGSFPGFGSAQVTVVGDELTYTSTNTIYKRRP